MDSTARMLFVVSSIGGLIEADPLFNPDYHSDQNSFLVSQNGKYRQNKTDAPDASRHPDRKLFTMDIYDQTETQLIAHHEDLLEFKWAHDKIGYTFVKDDNVYYVSTPGKSPVKISPDNGMRHGTFDWMYTEEIFGSKNHDALWFSPSDKYLAYASRPQNTSREVLLTTYTRGETYNFNCNMEYPKTGEVRIAEYSVSIYNIERNESIEMNVQLRDQNSFHYLFAVSWVVLHGKELLMTTWANRWQNETTITLCSYELGTCSLIYEHKYDPKQWATPSDYAIAHSNSSIFVILPKEKGDNAWQQIAKIEITAEFLFKSIEFLPTDDYDILRILSYQPDEDTIAYLAHAPHPYNENEYISPAGENSVIKGDQCQTCKLPTYLTNNKTHNSGAIEQHDNNSTHYCKIETLTLHNGYEAIVQICSGDTELSSIPVTLRVYGGPNEIQVSEGKRAKAGRANVFIDVRGSGGRGWKYRSPVYGRLVTVEVEDTIEAMQMVLDRNPRLDRNRVGLTGWSYGGTMTLALVKKSPGLFKCALAGAPVTNFMYYDAAYTERYMGDAPSSNYTDLTVDVSAFRNTTLMLVHGMRDDNVHFQNSALMIEALEKADIPFQLMVYPNEDHQSAAGNLHYAHLREKFFSDCYA
ncbi:hypothetical protein PMAYCL1PPCAC_22836 [Pristionchus mayeri]|uniref:Venom dipeptidyl peptidase 4 n=1 Tax=Pristionchus mayeri TaxID=1317129 RepID=A0AAN5CX10_9BILA|nr:hypothetical protein PMAYCL1PPCAC_22836 [Pristionchus mayeri]